MIPIKITGLAQTTLKISRKVNLLTLSIYYFFGILVPATAQENQREIFPRPAELESAISFWIRVYTEIDTDHGYLHDSEDLSVIYASLNRSSQEIETARQRIKNDLDTLATGKRTNLTDSQKEILALWPEGVSNQRLQQATNNVRWQVGQSNAFLEGLERSGAYRDYIDGVLIDKNLPPQLALLPHVESSFNPNAYSHANAAGMWQFTRPTGQRFMRIDRIIDERMDPYISADAAMDLLEYNYQVLGTWPLALTAYNQGVGRMSRAVRETGTDEIQEIIKNYKGPGFRFVGRNFYAQFLAVNDIERNIHQYFDDIQYESPITFTEVRLDSYIEAAGIERSFNIPLSQLRDDNPSLRNVVWQGLKRIPRGFRLRLRADQLPEITNFLAEIDSSYKHSTQLRDSYYEVRRGETLQAIASKFETTTEQLVSLNEIRNPDEIQAGQRISIPIRERSLANETQASSLLDETFESDPINFLEIGEELPNLPEPKTIGQTPSIEMTESEDEDMVNPIQGGTAEQGNKPDEALLVASRTFPDEQSRESTASEDLMRLEVPDLPQQSNVNRSASILDSDPSDYSVALDDTIVLQASESVGQLADWLEIPTWDIRELNNISFRDQVVIGTKVLLTFDRVSRTDFEDRRREFHANLQQDFFDNFIIRGAEEYEIKRADNISRLALNRYSTPLWLVRQYNPGINFTSVYVGQRVVFPLLQPIGSPNIN